VAEAREAVLPTEPGGRNGKVARWLPSAETAGDHVLAALARLVRALHEASAGWVPPPGAVWGGSSANAGRITERTELVSHRDYALGNVVFRGGLPAALIDFDLAKPMTRLYDIANALWYWAPLRDPRDRPPVLADADIPRRAAVFADTYGMTARQRAELAPLAVDMVRRYHEDSRASADLDPVWRKAWGARRWSRRDTRQGLPASCRGVAARSGPGDQRSLDPSGCLVLPRFRTGYGDGEP
jgi:hypothetical protein